MQSSPIVNHHGNPYIAMGDENEDMPLRTLSNESALYDSTVPSSNSSESMGSPLLDKYGKPMSMGQATLLSCTAAMTNTILGAGMLGLPHALAESGFLIGSILLVMAGFASAFALHLLAVSASTVNIWPSSFYVVASASVPRAAWLIDLAVAIKCFGVGTSFLIVIGDLIPEAVATFFGHELHSVLYDRRFWILIYMAAIVLPLACLRSLNALRFTATCSIFFVCFLCGVITLYAIVPSLDECAGMVVEACKGPTTIAKFDKGTLKILSIFIFGFTCHQNIFAASTELSNFTIPRINRVIGGCITIAGVIYTLIGLLAYSTYGSAVQSNILRNYPDNYVLAVARVMIATNCAFTFPLQLHPCRNSISLLIHQWQTRNLTVKGEVHVPSEWRITILTALICAASLGIAVVMKDLGVMLSIVGATGSTTISYILPGLIFLKLHPVWTRKHYAAATLFGMGCVIIPSCLTFIFI